MPVLRGTHSFKWNISIAINGDILDADEGILGRPQRYNPLAYCSALSPNNNFSQFMLTLMLNAVLDNLKAFRSRASIAY